jgi:catechol 2,3-dioxygenase-like lactoylglutathione lyase family enzyme
MAHALAFDSTITCALDVRNLDSALEWYKKTLGFEVVYKLDDHGWAEINSSVAGVTLGLGESEKVQQGGGVTVVFGVKDIDAARACLEKMDVRFDGPTRTSAGMVKLATFFDPDGNTFMFSQMLK